MVDPLPEPLPDAATDTGLDPVTRAPVVVPVLDADDSAATMAWPAAADAAPETGSVTWYWPVPLGFHPCGRQPVGNFLDENSAARPSGEPKTLLASCDALGMTINRCAIE